MTSTRKVLYWLIEMIIALLMITWLIAMIGARPDDFVSDTVMPFSESFQIQPSTMAAILMPVLVGYLFLIFWEGVRGMFSTDLRTETIEANTSSITAGGSRMTTINLGTVEEITARIDNWNATRKWWQQKAIIMKSIASELAGEHTIPELAAILASYKEHVGKLSLDILGLDGTTADSFKLAFRQARQEIRRSVSFYENANIPSFEGAFAEIFLLAVLFSFVLPFCGAAFGLDHAPAVGAAGGAFLACYVVAKLISLFIDGIERRGITRIERRK